MKRLRILVKNRKEGGKDTDNLFSLSELKGKRNAKHVLFMLFSKHLISTLQAL